MVSHLIGIAAYSILSSVIVLYTFLTLGALGFALLGGGVAVDGSPLQNLVLAALAVGDGAWVDQIWRPELSFEENALRLFGGFGFLLWVGELLIGRFRGAPPPPAPLWVRLRGFALKMAIFTALVSTVLLVSVLVVQIREATVTPFWVLRAAFTSYAMGAVVLLFSAPPLLFWFFLQAARGPVSDAIAGRYASDASPPAGVS